MTTLGGWDVHTHIIPSAVIAAGEKGLYGMRTEPKALQICAHGIPLHPLSKVDMLVERVKSDGLDGAIVSVPPPLFRPDLSSSDRASYAQLVNDSLLSTCSCHQHALRPFAYLPAEDPELAAEIASRLNHNWAGAVAGTELGVLSYASERYDALWQTLSDRKLPLFIHPGSSPDKRLDPFYLSNLLGNPVETTIAAANLIFAGVMHRFPGLKVILAHGGGCVAALCGRWQQGAITNRPDIPTLAQTPLDAVRQFYVDSIVHSPAYLTAIIDIIGADRILLGSDWPFPMSAPSAEHDLAHLDIAVKTMIRLTNAGQVFGHRLSTPMP
jgi:aminocarboxymuconate-semialdehyde decarboxylase